MREVAAEWIKPNDRLTSLERLQIYNRCYWFRVLDSLYDDFPGVKSVVGSRRFHRLITAYLAKYPSRSYTLRDLGERLPLFIEAEPGWASPRERLALDMARFEWAQVVAFDGPAFPPVHVDELLGKDPSELRLGLQPYITLLDAAYPVDNFALAIKEQSSDGLHSQASNVVESGPRRAAARRVRLPKPERTLVAVHRHANSIYFKRLEPGQFALLQALQSGGTVEDACAVAAEAAEASVDLAAEIREWFENAASLGWFCRFENREPKTD